MELDLLIIIAWISGFVLGIIQRPLTFVEHAVLFFINSIVITCLFTIFSLNLHLINISDVPSRFMAFLFYRSVVVQLILLIFANVMLTAKNAARKWLLAGAFLGLFIMLQGLVNLFGTMTFIRWNYGWTALLFLAFMLLTWVGASLLKQPERRVPHDPIR